uniref:Uncharacterized protein n=1 Tax=Caenorhabditis japonica TaxID=281687 RepID=A0A8R1HWZ5_CAEJA
MSSTEGSSNSDLRPNETFQKRDIKELLKFLPECEGIQMVASIDGVFELLEEKMGMVVRVLTSLLCKEPGKKEFPPLIIVRNVYHDCIALKQLMDVQKIKIQSLKKRNRKMVKLTQCEVKKETRLLKGLFPGRKKFPETPFTPDESEKQKMEAYDALIANVHRSVYRDFLLHPSPIFKVSEYLTRISKSPGKFRIEQLDTIIATLVNYEVIKAYKLPGSDDLVVVKEFRPNSLGISLRMFGITKQGYIEASIPWSLSTMKTIIDKLDPWIIDVLDRNECPILSEMFVAAVIKDTNLIVRYSDLPRSTPNSSKNAIDALQEAEFITLRKENGVSNFHKTPLGRSTQTIERRYLGRFEN